MMKPSSILINTARGAIFNLDHLYNALLSNTITAVGTDVLPIEPPDIEHPLIKAWKDDLDWISGRLIITPHSAFYNEESFFEMRKKAAEEVKRVLEGSKPFNPVKI